jgi:hypothetical protein
MNEKMRHTFVLFIATVWSVAVTGSAAGQSPATGSAEARDLVRRVETQYQGKISHAVAVMRVVTDRWNRGITLEMWSKGRDRFLVRILEPKKDEGVASLKIGNELWNYLPNIDRKKTGGTAEVTAMPKPDAAVVWGRLLYTIDTERLIPLSIRYYDEENTLVRTITFDDVRKVSGRWIPLRMLVRPEDKPSERTELVYSTLTFDVKLAEDFFSLRSLRRR